jgi:DNA anti-recombination protein RmuC
MDFGAAAQWAGTFFIAVGLGATWYRNGRSAAKEQGKTITEIKAVQGSVKGLTEKVDKIDDKLDTFQRDTVQICTSLTEKVNTNAREIDRLRNKGSP